MKTLKHVILIWLCGYLITSTGFSQRYIVGDRVQEGTYNYATTATGNDTYVITLSPAITSYKTGSCYLFKADVANVGAASLNINSVGAVTIKKTTSGVTTDLSDNDIRAGQIVLVCHDGTNFQMISAKGNDSGGWGGGGVSAVALYRDVFSSRASMSGFNMTVAGSANQGVCHYFTNNTAVISTGVRFKVTTVSGTSCTGGTCGFKLAIYPASRNSIVAQTEAGYSGHATSTKNINTTGWKELVWSSGTAVSGGTLTLPIGPYYLCTTSDSTVLTVSATNITSEMYVEVDGGVNDFGPLHGYTGSWSSGNGGSITVPTDWSAVGSLATSGNGEHLLWVFYTN